MDENAPQFRKVGSESPIVGDAEVEIRRASSPPAFSDTPLPTGEFAGVTRCRYINQELNSRTGNRIGSGKWFLRHEARVDANLHPAYITNHADRILIQGEGPWQLFDIQGKSIAKGYSHNSDVYLSPETGVFIYSNDTGMVAAHDLETGRLKFVVSLYFGDSFYRTFLSLNGDRLLAVSIEQEIDQDNEEKPYRSMIERRRVDQPLVIDGDRVLRSTKGTGTLVQESLKAMSAATDGYLVTATDGRINVFRDDLTLAASLVGSLDPVGLSLGGNEIIYVVIADGDAYKLRAINFKGERLFSTLLPPKMQYQNCPPIVSYDSNIYLLAGNHLLALNKTGHGRWEYRSPYDIAGAVVTPENELLVASGPEVGIFDAAGNFRLLYKLENEVLRTPPAILPNGDVIVASDSRLYCLSANGS